MNLSDTTLHDTHFPGFVTTSLSLQEESLSLLMLPDLRLIQIDREEEHAPGPTGRASTAGMYADTRERYSPLRNTGRTNLERGHA